MINTVMVPNEWYLCDEKVDGSLRTKQYMCPRCGNWNGHIHRRRIVEAEGDHVEYRIKCASCDYSTSVHRTKDLVKNVWKGNGGAVLGD